MYLICTDAAYISFWVPLVYATAEAPHLPEKWHQRGPSIVQQHQAVIAGQQCVCTKGKIGANYSAHRQHHFHGN